MTLTDETKSRRSGGRAARHDLRSRPLADDIRPVRPGLSGGRFQPLTDHDVRRIHEAALQLLEEVGFGQAIPSCVEACTRLGATYDGKRLRFPRALVEDTVAKAARHFVLHGQDPRHDMEPRDKRVYYGTAGAAVHVVDLEKRHYRESLLKDLYDASRIVDAMDNIHFFQRSMVPRDLEDPREMDINTLYASIAGTTKHVGTSMVMPEHVDEAFAILHAVAGSEAAWRARPFVSQSNCFVVPPMKFAEDACRCLEAAVHGGMPVLLLSAGQAGATAPAAIAGAVVQATAECLCGLVYVNAIKPGHPCIFGTWPFVSDLRSGAMSGGSAEQALLTAACAQMAHFYDLPGGSAAGMADSKEPDIQAGYEKGITTTLAGLAGLNLVYESAGMHASLLGFSHESLIIDNDILGMALSVRARHRSHRRNAVGRDHSRRLHERARPLPRPLADAGTDAARVHLPGDRQPPQPEGMGGSRQARHHQGGDRQEARTAGEPFPQPHSRRRRRRDPGEAPDKAAKGEHAGGEGAGLGRGMQCCTNQG